MDGFGTIFRSTFDTEDSQRSQDLSLNTQAEEHECGRNNDDGPLLLPAGYVYFSSLFPESRIRCSMTTGLKIGYSGGVTFEKDQQGTYTLRRHALSDCIIPFVKQPPHMINCNLARSNLFQVPTKRNTVVFEEEYFNRNFGSQNIPWRVLRDNLVESRKLQAEALAYDPFLGNTISVQPFVQFAEEAAFVFTPRGEALSKLCISLIVFSGAYSDNVPWFEESAKCLAEPIEIALESQICQIEGGERGTDPCYGSPRTAAAPAVGTVEGDPGGNRIRNVYGITLVGDKEGAFSQVHLAVVRVEQLQFAHRPTHMAFNLEFGDVAVCTETAGVYLWNGVTPYHIRVLSQEKTDNPQSTCKRKHQRRDRRQQHESTGGREKGKGAAVRSSNCSERNQQEAEQNEIPQEGGEEDTTLAGHANDHAVWLQCTFGAHPQSLFVVQRERLILLDFKRSLSNRVELLSAEGLARGDSFCCLMRHPQDRFKFVLLSRSQLFLFDERKISEPLVVWDHLMTQDQPFLFGVYRVEPFSQWRTSRAGGALDGHSDSLPSPKTVYAILVGNRRQGTARMFQYVQEQESESAVRPVRTPYQLPTVSTVRHADRSVSYERGVLHRWPRSHTLRLPRIFGMSPYFFKRSSAHCKGEGYRSQFNMYSYEDLVWCEMTLVQVDEAGDVFATGFSMAEDEAYRFYGNDSSLPSASSGEEALTRCSLDAMCDRFGKGAEEEGQLSSLLRLVKRPEAARASLRGELADLAFIFGMKKCRSSKKNYGALFRRFCSSPSGWQQEQREKERDLSKETQQGKTQEKRQKGTEKPEKQGKEEQQMGGKQERTGEVEAKVDGEGAIALLEPLLPAIMNELHSKGPRSVAELHSFVQRELTQRREEEEEGARRKGALSVSFDAVEEFMCRQMRIKDAASSSSGGTISQQRVESNHQHRKAFEDTGEEGQTVQMHYSAAYHKYARKLSCQKQQITAGMVTPKSNTVPVASSSFLEMMMYSGIICSLGSVPLKAGGGHKAMANIDAIYARMPKVRATGDTVGEGRSNRRRRDNINYAHIEDDTGEEEEEEDAMASFLSQSYSLIEDSTQDLNPKVGAEGHSSNTEGGQDGREEERIDTESPVGADSLLSPPTWPSSLTFSSSSFLSLLQTKKDNTEEYRNNGDEDSSYSHSYSEEQNKHSGNADDKYFPDNTETQAQADQRRHEWLQARPKIERETVVMTRFLQETERQYSAALRQQRREWPLLLTSIGSGEGIPGAFANRQGISGGGVCDVLYLLEHRQEQTRHQRQRDRMHHWAKKSQGEHQPQITLPHVSSKIAPLQRSSSTGSGKGRNITSQQQKAGSSADAVLPSDRLLSRLPPSTLPTGSHSAGAPAEIQRTTSSPRATITGKSALPSIAGVAARASPGSASSPPEILPATPLFPSPTSKTPASATPLPGRGTANKPVVIASMHRRTSTSSANAQGRRRSTTAMGFSSGRKKRKSLSALAAAAREIEPPVLPSLQTTASNAFAPPSQTTIAGRGGTPALPSTFNFVGDTRGSVARSATRDPRTKVVVTPPPPALRGLHQRHTGDVPGAGADPGSRPAFIVPTIVSSETGDSGGSTQQQPASSGASPFERPTTSHKTPTRRKRRRSQGF